MTRFLPLLLASLVSLASFQQAHADTIVLLVSEDVAPYSFLPSLPRYNNPTAYAFDGVSDTGTHHQFETFLWFDVSADDIPAGHVLTDARLVLTHSFDASGFGEPTAEPALLECREVLETWDQTTLTWLNRPVYDEPFDTIADITEFGSVLCDARAVVFDWVHGVTNNDGFAITNPSPRVFGMYTLEADPVISDSLKANLVLTTELPEPGTGISLALGSVALAGAARRKRREPGECRGPRKCRETRKCREPGDCRESNKRVTA